MTAIGTVAPRPATAPAKKEWTVLFYGAGDNDLCKFELDSIEQMNTVGCTPKINLVAQMDHGDGTERLEAARTGAKTIEALGETDCAAPETLSDFIKWGVKNYPAEHYMLVVSDHGDGWRGCVEDGSSHGWMKLPALEQGLKDARAVTGQKMDVVGFDACLMGSLEVAYQLRDEADYMIGSEDVEPGAGWDYQQFLQQHFGPSSSGAVVTPKTLCEAVVASSEMATTTMSAYDMSQVPALAKAVDELGAAIASTPGRGFAHQMRKMAHQATSFPQGPMKFIAYRPYRDLYGFAQNIISNDKIDSADVKAKAAAVKDAIEKTVVSEQHDPTIDGTHGVTVQLPFLFFHVPADYKATAFAKDTHWDEALQRMGHRLRST